MRIYPTKAQKEKLQQAFEGNRWAWNILVEKTKDSLFEDNVKINDLKKQVRPLVQKRTMAASDRLKKVPEEALDSAYRDIWKARSSILAASKARKKKTGKGFNCKYLHFRRRKNSSHSIEIRSRSIKVTEDRTGFEMWSSYFGSTRKNPKLFTVKEKLPELNYSCRLQMMRTGEYYLCIPEYKQIEKANTKKTCAIDPGVRTMLTGYDPEGTIFELGLNIDKIAKRLLIADQLQSRLRMFKGRRNARYNLKTGQLNIFGRIKRMVKDCHHKITRWISDNYHKVLLPKFATGEMVRKVKRVIGAETARKMLAWSHWSFKELLRHKMEMREGKLIDCTEEYTSKTCTKCGRLNHILGHSKLFKCPYDDCELKIDRDVGAARNIYLKNSYLLD